MMACLSCALQPVILKAVFDLGPADHDVNPYFVRIFLADPAEEKLPEAIDNSGENKLHSSFGQSGMRKKNSRRRGSATSPSPSASAGIVSLSTCLSAFSYKCT